MSGETTLAARIAAVRTRIDAAAAAVGRDPKDVTLVGVSKKKPANEVAAAVRAGLTHLGENYVQEARAKLGVVGQLLADPPGPTPRWHFIGQLQRNKARDVVRDFDVIETVDRASLGAELETRAAAAGRTLDVLIQVNVSGEAQKGGVDPDSLEDLLGQSRAWSNLRVIGLMGVPARATNPEANRESFRALRELRDRTREAPGGEGLQQLSMGMSGDFEIAIEEGATIVRVGTSIFGPRENA